MSTPLLRCCLTAKDRRSVNHDHDLAGSLPGTPVDRSSSIRFRFFVLRLAKSGLYSPHRRIPSRTQQMVDDHIRAKTDSKRMKYAKVEDWDSGISDC